MRGEILLTFVIAVAIATISFKRPNWMWQLHNFGWVRGGEPTEFARAAIFAQGVIAAFVAVLVLIIELKG
jgi:hypothetical protein